MRKQFFNSIAMIALIFCLSSAMLAQQNRVYREGNNWGQEANGSLSGAKNIRIRVAFGAVRVQGG